jgi:allantoin racemase
MAGSSHATIKRMSSRVWYQSFTDPDVDAAYFDRLSAYLRSVAGPGIEVDAHGIQPGDRYLHPITEFRCAAQVIANALEAQDRGYAAFVIGHFQEPALNEALAAVDIPVIGLGEASMFHACTLGRKVGLVTINPVFVPYHEEQIARHGLGERVVAVRAVQAQVATTTARSTTTCTRGCSRRSRHRSSRCSSSAST